MLYAKNWAALFRQKRDRLIAVGNMHHMDHSGLESVGNSAQPLRNATIQKMSPWRREKIFRVIDGNQDLFVPMFHWNQFVRCDDLLEWCLRHHLTGSSLSVFISRHGILAAAQEILRRIDRFAVASPVIMGRDYLS